MRHLGSEVRYSAEVFGHRVGFGERPALVVVDLIEGFADPHAAFGFDLTSILNATTKLLGLARRKRLPVIFTTTAYEDPGFEAGVWLLKMPALQQLRLGSHAVELLPQLERQPGEPLITKKFASAFFGTTLASLLTSLRADTVVIAGCTTSGCVRATAVDAVQHGFRTVVVADCVGDRLQEAHAASLRDLDAKYCDVLTLAETLNSVSELPS